MACAHTPKAYLNEKPTLNFVEYFTGKVDGYGIVYDWRGKVSNRFHVVMDGKMKTNDAGEQYLRLDETFTYPDGQVIERYWEIFATDDPTELRAQSADIPGGAVGVQMGNSIHWKYLIEIPMGADGKRVTLRSSDWMWLLEDGKLMNRNQFYKFGLPVAQLQLFFNKRDTE